MACDYNVFHAALPTECLFELASDVLAGNPMGAGVYKQSQKVAYCLGSIMSYMDSLSLPHPVMGDAPSASKEELAEKVKALCDPKVMRDAQGRFDPANLAALLAFLKAILPLILPLFI
jgi:hypothetical protein